MGNWTYHPKLENAYYLRFSQDTWSVTHLPSGAIAIFCTSEEDARTCVEFLAADWPLSDNPESDCSLMQTLKAALLQAREQGQLFFFLGHEERAVVASLQENQWERELVAALG